MRIIFVFLIAILTSLRSNPQSNELYRAVLTDASNFYLIKMLGGEVPSPILVLDTTYAWNPDRFWIADLENVSDSLIRALSRDEHHPYNHSYLFRERRMPNLVPIKEQKKLRERAAQLKPRSIELLGSNYKTISSAAGISGYFFRVSDPVFSSDGNLAFVDIVIHFKAELDVPEEESSYATTCVAYRNEGNGSWKRVAITGRLIL